MKVILRNSSLVFEKKMGDWVTKVSSNQGATYEGYADNCVFYYGSHFSLGADYFEGKRILKGIAKMVNAESKTYDTTVKFGYCNKADGSNFVEKGAVAQRTSGWVEKDLDYIIPSGCTFAVNIRGAMADSSTIPAGANGGVDIMRDGVQYGGTSFIAAIDAYAEL